MDIPKSILDYLTHTYDPEGIIVYGSYADGSAGEFSDFDALLIARHAKTHDSSVISGTVLDVFIYPPETFRSDYDPEDFLQLFDGRILLDKYGTARRLQRQVLDYIEKIPYKTRDTIRQAMDWCDKMLARTGRLDAEGFFRWHWLLTESLEIYYDVMRRRYFGPKKALRTMAVTDSEAFRLYSLALQSLDRARLADWISYLHTLADKNFPEEQHETTENTVRNLENTQQEHLYRETLEG